MQNINCDYEIIVADDYSTDDTLEILSRYQKLYADIINIIPSTANLGITKNYQKAFKECRGKYIAILEGDDYWISPNKITKQMLFLEANKDCSLCSHQLFIHNEVSNSVTLASVVSREKFNTEFLINNNFIGNFSSCMYRKDVIDQIPPHLYELNVYDWMFNIVCSLHGYIGYILEPLSVYRLHKQGLWSSAKKQEARKELSISIDEYNKFLNYKYDKEFNIAKFKHTNSNNFNSIVKGVFSYQGLGYIAHYVLPPIFIIFLGKIRKFLRKSIK